MDIANIQYVVYDGVEPNPTTRIVYDALHFYQEHQCDAIIAIGGGSPIDVAKAVSILSANGGKIQDYNGYNKSKKRGTPIIAVNTTAGTGSECTRAYVVTDEETKTKMLMVDTNCLAHLALNDPMLMVGMPPSLTAATGIDALTHAIEAYICNTHTPYTDALAEKAFTLAWQNLRPAWETAGESGAKGNMLLASNLAGIAFNAAGLGICHSLAHALGGRFHLPHGRLNALILPHVIHFNAADGTAAEKYGRLARLCGLAANPRSLAAGLNRLRAQLKLPERLSACGVEGKELTAALDGLAEAAQADLCAPSNPRPAAAEDLKSLLRELA